MTDPQLAHTDDSGRMYSRVRGGTPEVPSITTVLDVLNQNMEWWEALCAVRLAMEHAELLVDVKQMPNGRPRWDRERKAKDWLVEAAIRDRDEAAERGDFVHNYAEVFALHALGQASADDLAQQQTLCERAGVMDYVANFHAFWMDYNPRPLQPEATVWNSSVGYAGTTDLVCEIMVGGVPVVTVLDYKTKRALYKRNGQMKDKDLRDYTGMQLAAAAFAEEVWVPGSTPDTDEWLPFPFQIEVGLAVALAPDGYVVRQYPIHNPLYWESFVSLARAWKFKRGGEALMSGRLAGPDSIARLDVPRLDPTVSGLL